MKTGKLSFIFLFLFGFNTSYSQIVKIEEAQKIAQNVFAELFGSKSFEISDDVISLGEKNEATLYIFNCNKNGFVIISADKSAYPLLAFSSSSVIPNDKENWSPSFTAWLEMYNQQINFIREKNIIPDKTITEKWELFEKGKNLNLKSSKDVAPLLSTTWSQDCGYNALCPVASGGPCGRVYTGCVATAMAQVMRYMEYPASGNGSQCYTTANYGELCADFESAVYDYSTMTTSSGNAEVAELMYHCGVSVFMNYSPSGSGAYSHNVVNAWKNFFDYKNHILISKGNYEESDWIRILKHEIDNSRPLYYAGFGSGGHAFVFDGYQATDHFHINWGWGGSYNGYFYVTNLNPAGHDYTNSQQTIVGAIPSPLFTNLDVSGAVNLSCATPVSGDISTGVDNINYYKNSYPSAVGKELVYTFTTTLPGRIRIKITDNVGGDVNVFLLSYAHQDSLIASGTNNLVVDNTLPKTYYVAVEGNYGKEPSFNIEVICPTIDADLIFLQSNVSPQFIESLMPNVILSSTIKNIGNTDAGSCNIEYYLSDNQIFDGSDILLGSDIVSGINIGETLNFSTRITMPAGLTSGSYYVIFNLDPENSVVESDDDNFSAAFTQVPDAGIMDCSSSISLQDGVWHYGNTQTDGASNIIQYWSASDMTGPEVIHSFTPLYNGFAKISYIEKVQGQMNAIILPICNENTYLANIWFNNITDTIGFADIYVTAGTEYFVIVDGFQGAFGDYALKVDLPQQCPNIEIEISGKTDLCDGDTYPALWTKWGANSYQWYKDGIPIPLETSSWFSTSSVGSYHLEMTENGCTASSEIINVQMSFPPDTAQIASTGDLEFCLGGSVDLSLSKTVIYPMNWAKNGELIEGATSANFTASESGIYTLITTNGSCSVSSSNSITVETKKPPSDIAENLPVPSDNIKFYYTFEKDNSDYSGNNYFFNCWNFMPENDRFGNFWQARYFTADDVFGYSSYLASSPSEFTLSLWFKTNSENGGVLAGFFDNPWNASQMEAMLYMSDNGKLHFYMTNGGTPAELVSVTSYNDNNWHLVTIQYNGNMKMSINNESELLINSNSISKLNFDGYWAFAGSNLPANVADMPSSKYFDGSLDDIICVYETNNFIDKYNYFLPELNVTVETDTENCAATPFEVKILNSELNINYRLWNETTSSWFSDAVSGNFGEITIAGNSNISETSVIKIFAENSVTNCSKFLNLNTIVNIYPATNIITEPEGATICDTENYTFTVNVIGENLNYQWKKDGLNIGTNSNYLVIENAEIADNGQYFCEITGFCGSVTSETVQLTVLEHPQAQAGNNETICGNTTQLNAFDPSPFTGEWSILQGSAVIENSTLYNTNITDAGYGDISIRWTVTNGFCSSFDDITLTLVQIPTANFSYEQINELEYQFNNLSENASSYLWDFGDGIGTSTEENPLYNFLYTGDYEVVLYAYNNICENSITHILPIYLDISNIIENNFSIYPNPTSGIINLTGFSNLTVFAEPVSVKITDITGKTILTTSGSQIDISHLQSGIYFLKIETEKGVFVKKIIKQ